MPESVSSEAHGKVKAVFMLHADKVMTTREIAHIAEAAGIPQPEHVASWHGNFGKAAAPVADAILRGFSIGSSGHGI